MSDFKEFIISDTYESTIEPIQKCFDMNGPELIYIELNKNSGGNLIPVLELIEHLRHAEQKVLLSAKGHIFSAAAVLYFKVLLEKDDSNFRNVSFTKLKEPLLVLFHSPRNESGEFIKFPATKGVVPSNQTPLDIEGQHSIVEAVFHKFLEKTGNRKISSPPEHEEFSGMKHKSQHILECWNSNFDCIFTWHGADEKS